ncbi:MAG: hypothetical protein GWO24_10965, partial [Akkermansiaceae bacterium]|nr:hypothetical protein [Akkermansiaceae bacterium]
MVSTLGTTPIQGFPTPTSAWQSFTATADGPIADAWMQLDLVGADSVEFRIYEGEGTGGNLLATDAGALVSTTNGNTFGASPAAQVTEGQLYTLEIVGVAAGGTSPTFRIPFDDLGYTGGKANLQPQDGSPQVN